MNRKSPAATENQGDNVTLIERGKTIGAHVSARLAKLLEAAAAHGGVSVSAEVARRLEISFALDRLRATSAEDEHATIVRDDRLADGNRLTTILSSGTIVDAQPGVLYSVVSDSPPRTRSKPVRK